MFSANIISRRAVSCARPLERIPQFSTRPSKGVSSPAGYLSNNTRRLDSCRISPPRSTTSSRPLRTLQSSARGYLIVLALALIPGYYLATDTRSGIHHYLSPPILRFLYSDAEEAHEIGTRILSTLRAWGLNPRDRSDIDASGALSTSVFGHTITNPVGISAGLDKHADIPDALFDVGPGIVEVGGITPLAQPGNERPRVWRVPSQKALINRYGLNSVGAEAVAETLRRRVLDYAAALGLPADEKLVLNNEAGIPPGSLVEGRLLAVQIAKNKTTPETDFEAVKNDYVKCVQHLGKYADIIVVNVSSPNTPGLRSLQATEPLTAIMSGVVQAAKAVDRRTKPAVMVKVSPDQDTDEQIKDICRVVYTSGVDGIIVGNTTTKRPEALPIGFDQPPKERKVMLEQGGYSGPQLFPKTLELVGKYRQFLDNPENQLGATELSPSKTLFATGGITNGKQAKQILDAGASVAMVYTALVYHGVGLINEMKQAMLPPVSKPKP